MKAVSEFLALSETRETLGKGVTSGTLKAGSMLLDSFATGILDSSFYSF